MRTLILVLVVAAACGGKKSGPPPAAPAPAKPSTGAPVAFEAVKVTPGGENDGTIDLKAYNFSDRTIGTYMVLLRYHDASGAVIKVKPGTPFEKDNDFWSFSGLRYLCKPASWCEFKLDHLDVPAKAASVEVLAQSLTAVGSDGVHFDDKPLFELPSMDWPAAPAK
jgi:hypothetical protein